MAYLLKSMNDIESDWELKKTQKHLSCTECVQSDDLDLPLQYELLKLTYILRVVMLNIEVLHDNVNLLFPW